MLNQPVLHIKGVGEKMLDTMHEMGIETVGDFLFYFPYRYDFFEVKPLTELVHDEKATIEGKVFGEPSLSFFGRKKSRLTVTLQVDQFAIKAVFFNRAFVKKQLQDGDTITVTGKWDAHRLQMTVSNYKKGRAKNQDPIQPIYSLKGNLKHPKMRKMMEQALADYGNYIDEIIPEQYLKQYKIPHRVNAVKHTHFPGNRLMLKHARRRFVYEEFLLFQLKMQLLRKMKRESTKGNTQDFDRSKLEQFIGTLPFSLTSAQERSLNEILEDMSSPYRMNRLLQGDVGSGKTAVAAIGLYASVTANKQGAIMVPTEILADQHYASLKEMFGDKLNVVLLTGSIKGKRRKAVLEQIESREADIIVGTHALIQVDVNFAKLGLVIIDEQHRFGVNQRRTLRDKGLNPDVLFMTATPIPRTLAITAFGDMDVSTIDEMPKGRKPIDTYWTKPNTLDRVLQFINKEVESGHQAYVICPLIEESEKLDIQNAVDLHQQLNTYFPENICVGLMHGRLTNEEKENAMKAFANNEAQILVSTTVVEVGVNVPNATVMVIYDAERFGLSQLHQLRGRVGRGGSQSFCILLADPKTDIGKERMRIMSETTNGFELSEHDLKLRGPGDFFGKKQSGLPVFKVADMVHDYRALETARVDAAEIINSNLLYNDTRFARLRQEVENDEILRGEVLD